MGSSWRDHRWDSFRLVTENSLCNLPNFPCTKIGADPRGFMSRDDIVNYLQAFQKECQIPVRFNTAAVKVTKGWAEHWVVELAVGSFLKADCVIVGCGGFHTGKLPPWASQVPDHIKQLHSFANE